MKNIFSMTYNGRATMMMMLLCPLLLVCWYCCSLVSRFLPVSSFRGSSTYGVIMSPKVASTKESEQKSVAPSNINGHPWDVAVVYDSLAMQKCGHCIPWNRFQDVPHTCPYCQAKIVLICDANSSKNVVVDDSTILFFKYNKQAFKLSLSSPKRRSWWNRRDVTAQERMAYALRMNEANGIKVLCKGKVLYPNNSTCTATDISNQLLDISRQDLTSGASKKPSLVVMGTRQGQGLHEPRQALWSIVLGMGMTVVAHIFKLAYGTAMYMYSYIKPLPPPEAGRDE